MKTESGSSTGVKEYWNKEYFLLLAAAICVITICSCSSPLYPLNTWVDANSFFTVGKAMFNGMVLYRDIYEQKGPLLYVVYGIGWLFSKNTFHAIYVIEIIACFFYLLFAYNIVRLFDDKRSVLGIPVMAAIVYSARNFSLGGSAEELCLPLLIYPVYVSFKAFENKTDISIWEYLKVGITAGCILWVKYTMTGLYVGWYLVLFFVMLKRHDYGKIVKSILMVLTGVMIATLPVAVYFIYNHAINDCIQTYFINNIFIYGASAGIIGKAKLVLHGLRTAGGFSKILWPLIGIGGVWLILRRNRVETAQYILMAGILAIFTYAGGKTYAYYAIPFSAFAPFMIPAIRALFSKAVLHISDRNVAVFGTVCSIAVAFLISVTVSKNTGDIGPISSLPQYKFAQIMNQSGNPTLLNYGFLDGGFYTEAEIAPTCKYFQKMNIQLPEMMEEQDRYVREGVTEYVVTKNHEHNWSKYKECARCTFSDVGDIYDSSTYYLYKKIR